MAWVKTTEGCLKNQKSHFPELSQAESHSTIVQHKVAKELSYSGTGCRWKGQRMGVFSICAEKGPELRPASPVPHELRQPLWPRHGGGFRSGGFSGDSRASGFCSPPPGLGAFWIALQHQTQHSLTHWESASSCTHPAPSHRLVLLQPLPQIIKQYLKKQSYFITTVLQSKLLLDKVS